MPWIIVFLTLIEFSSAKLASLQIYWNASNPIFRIDNTDHIIDVNRGNNPFEYDQVNIICPTYTKGSKEEAETYIIYNVSKEEYDSCRITNSNARIIAICDNPHQLKYFTITFRSFTPQPGGLEFKPGQDYYFITTSTGKREGLDRRLGGRCSTHHMKVIFKVCCFQNGNNSNNNSNNAVLNDKSDANNNNIIKINSNVNNQTLPSPKVDPSSSSSSSELFIESSSSSPSVISSTLSPSPVTFSMFSSSSSASSSSSQSKHKDFNIDRDFTSDDWSSSSGPFSNVVNSKDINVMVAGSVISPLPPTPLSPTFSSTTTLGPLVTSTFSVSPEHWWRPHYTRIQDLKWRSKGPGNSVVKDGSHHHLSSIGLETNAFSNSVDGNNGVGGLGMGHPHHSVNSNNSHNNNANISSNDTLRPIAWTIFAIACFIFIIFWALWCKVRRNNVMLPMYK